MASNKKKNRSWATPNKKTSIGNGTYSKKPHSGGETFHGSTCAGSTPSSSRRKRKPYLRPRRGMKTLRNLIQTPEIPTKYGEIQKKKELLLFNCRRKEQ